MNGVQANATGVRVNQERRLDDIRLVYYSRNATANILSMSTLVDSGARVIYDQSRNGFTVQPRGSATVYNFNRRNLSGNESKFYVCTMGKEMLRVTNSPTTLVTTVAANLTKYAKREVIGARKDRELLARLGYPSV